MRPSFAPFDSKNSFSWLLVPLGKFRDKAGKEADIPASLLVRQHAHAAKTPFKNRLRPAQRIQQFNLY
jgi:hypothetical protein